MTLPDVPKIPQIGVKIRLSFQTAEVNEGYPVYTSGDLFMWWMWHGPEGHWVVNKTPGAHGGDVVKSEFDLDMCPDKVANWQDGSTFQCGSPTVATTSAPPARDTNQAIFSYCLLLFLNNIL